MPDDATQHAATLAKFGPVTLTPKTPGQIDLTDFQPGDVVFIDTSILRQLGEFPYRASRILVLTRRDA